MIKIEICTINEAFENNKDYEVARILRELADKIEEEGFNNMDIIEHIPSREEVDRLWRRAIDEEILKFFGIPLPRPAMTESTAKEIQGIIDEHLRTDPESLRVHEEFFKAFPQIKDWRKPCKRNS